MMKNIAHGPVRYKRATVRGYLSDFDPLFALCYFIGGLSLALLFQAALAFGDKTWIRKIF